MRPAGCCCMLAACAAVVAPCLLKAHPLAVTPVQHCVPFTLRGSRTCCLYAQESLFERLLACGAAEPHMLTTQYRMHPGIAALPSDCFYGGLLDTHYSNQVRHAGRVFLSFPAQA